MGSHAYTYCVCFTRRFRSQDAHPPHDVRAAHSAAAAENGLRRFLADVQREHPAEADRILAALSGGGGIARFVGRSPAAVPTLDAFFRFLFSPDLNPPIDNKVRSWFRLLRPTGS